MRRSRALLASIVVAGAVLAPRAGAFVPPNRNLRPPSDMVYVPSATFTLGAEAHWGGATPGTGYSISPAREVNVAAFWLDRTEVTTAAYEACVKSGQCDALLDGDNFAANHTPICNYGKADHADHPINCVSFDEAKAYCASIGKRLPTEAEFELAERGVDARPFPWGDDPPTPLHVNACDSRCAHDGMAILNESFSSLWQSPPDDDGWPFTAPVGTYPKGASPFGALDMSGNVEEWVDDFYGDPSPSAERVVRGGSWDLATVDTFAATRRTDAASTTRAAWLGFRCARGA